MAGHRNPESYVAGASAINRDGPRYSDDIDIFHDREESVATAADADAALLAEKGFAVCWLRREPGVHAALVGKGGEETRLEWARDSDFRFFPTVKDELFGYRLTLFDLAANKALAAAGRREPRDVLDLLTIHEHYFALGAVIWASVAKDPGVFSRGPDCGNSPQCAISGRRLRRSCIDGAGRRRRRDPPVPEALDQADAFVRAMPAGKEGLAFLKDGAPTQPDPENLSAYES